ncbi:MAG: gluconate 2-dehydrogenase subunit 3 family protein [Proteobacteria bacterium]|nr:gluconate 2-dehydrogenase subunit 3 family protein [Pseudomonadota bacterium]
MTTERKAPTCVDRRTTIKWLAATMVAANTGCSSSTKFLGDEIPAAPNAEKALLGVAATPSNVGYGTDPDLINPVVPWPRTMTDAQLRTAATTCDMILPADDQSPAASAVGVPDFIDEWVSAPYEQQQHDRELILGGLEWLEQQSQSHFGTTFSSANGNQAAELLDSIAYPDTAAAGNDKLIEFFRRFRYLTVGAYYSTEAGIKDIGYIGNVPISGDYPGPSTEAMAHLAGVLDELGLSLPS